MEIIIDELLGDKLKTADLTGDSLLDSFPVMIAKEKGQSVRRLPISAFSSATKFIITELNCMLWQFAD